MSDTNISAEEDEVFGFNAVSDNLLQQENTDLRDRVTYLEKRLSDQNDEVACLKSAIADCLRRLHTLETTSKGNRLPATPRSPMLGNMLLVNTGAAANEVQTIPLSAAPGVGKSGGSGAGPANRRTTGATGASNRGRTSTGDSLPSPSSSGSAGTLAGPLRKSTANLVNSAAPTPRTPKEKKLGGSTTALDHHASSAKEAMFLREEGSLRIFLRGRPVNTQLPTEVAASYDVKAAGEAPPEKLKLEWVYGYRGRDSRCNVHCLPSGELVYFVASVVVLHNVQEQTQRHYLGHTDDVKCIAVHPNRVTIATGQVAGHDRSQGKPHVRIWNSVNLNTLHILGLGEFERALCCIAFSKVDGGNLLCAVDEANEHVISVWEWQKGHKVTETKSSTEPVLAAEFHPQEANSIVTCGKSHLAFWTLEGCQLSKKMAVFEKYEKPKFVLCMTFAENGDLITGDSTGNLFLWRKGTQRIGQAMLNAHDGNIFSVCMTKGGQLISGGGKDRKLIQWDSAYNRTGVEVEIGAQYGAVRTIMEGPNGGMVVGTTRNCVLHGTLGGEELRPVVEGHAEELWGVACHPRQHQFITAGYDRTVILWDALTRQAVWTKELPQDASPAHSAAFHPQGDLVAIGCQNGKWLVMNTTQREIVESHVDGIEQIQCLAYSPDGSRLALGSRDNCLYVYSVSEDGRKYTRAGKCCGHSSFVLHIDWSQDSQHLRSTSGDYEILYWAASNCRQVAATSTLRDIEWATQTCTLGWSVAGIWPEGADGTDVNACGRAHERALLATADDFGKVNLFKYPVIQPKAPCHTYGGHSSHVTNVDFLFDDSRLISTGGQDTAIMQWEIVA